MAGGLAVLLWLIPAAFVVVYDPTVAHEPTAIEGAIEGALPGAEPGFFLLSHGYVRSWGVTTWEGDEATADKHSAHYHVERGPLDRRAGTFMLAVRCNMDHASDLEAVRLYVSSEPRADDGERPWAPVAEALIDDPGATHVTLTCRADVPASTVAYRLEEVRDGKSAGGFSQSMLTAPTLLGRIYDRIAWLPPFRWVPDIR
jgi:hypothetical protein